MARLRRRRPGGGLDAADLGARSRQRLREAEAWGGVMLQRRHATSAIPSDLSRVGWEWNCGTGCPRAEEAAAAARAKRNERRASPSPLGLVLAAHWH